MQKQNSRTTTSLLLGKFSDDSKTRLEFLTLIQPFNRIAWLTLETTIEIKLELDPKWPARLRLL